MRELDLHEINLVDGGDAFSSGFDGASLGAGLGGLGGAAVAFTDAAGFAAVGARYGAIGGLGGAALGAVLGVGYYYYFVA